MSKIHESVSDAAAFLADDPKVKAEVERETTRSSLVTALLHMRVQKGYTQKQIADAMHCDPSKISKMESGNDASLKWIDIAGYLSAVGVRMNILFEDSQLPAADRIKQHVFMIHDLLERLADLAKEVDDDTDITDKIHQFYGEVLFNFLARFGDSYAKLSSVLQIPEAEACAMLFPGTPPEGKAKAKKSKAAQACLA